MKGGENMDNTVEISEMGNAAEIDVKALEMLPADESDVAYGDASSWRTCWLVTIYI